MTIYALVYCFWAYGHLEGQPTACQIVARFQSTEQCEVTRANGNFSDSYTAPLTKKFRCMQKDRCRLGD